MPLVGIAVRQSIDLQEYDAFRALWRSSSCAGQSAVLRPFLAVDILFATVLSDGRALKDGAAIKTARAGVHVTNRMN